MSLEIKPSVDPSLYEIGVVVCRFQVKELHESHLELIDVVCANHKKVIIFLGVPPASLTRKNPLDYATREVMLKELYPRAIILPLRNMREDIPWSKSIDAMIPIPFGEHSALLYGSRDSFISSYKGNYPTVELITDTSYSGTESRSVTAKEILPSKDFRAGIIHAVYARREITYPTVDAVAYNEKGQILLCKKPNEELMRFIGGFVNRSDDNYESAAKREFCEETNGCEIGDLTYVASIQVRKDWRFEGEEDGVMTTLFIGKFLFGNIKATDDIESLHWVHISEINVDTDIMPEHRELYVKLMQYFSLTHFLTKVVREHENK